MPEPFAFERGAFDLGVFDVGACDLGVSEVGACDLPVFDVGVCDLPVFDGDGDGVEGVWGVLGLCEPVWFTGRAFGWELRPSGVDEER